MNSQSGGIVSALFTILPLLAIPAVAVVGIPARRAQPDLEEIAADGFMSLTEIAGGDSSDEKLSPDVTQGFSGDNDVSHSATHDQSSAQGAPRWGSPAPLDPGLFSPFVEVNDEDDSPFESTIPDVDPFADSDDHADIARSEPNLPARGIVSPAAATTRQNLTSATGRDSENSSAIAEAKPQSLSWEQVVRQLNELNITRYRLQESQSGDGFYFYCLYSHPRQPEIQHRFEAEGSEPIEAAGRTLDQIDQWIQSTAVASRMQ